MSPKKKQAAGDKAGDKAVTITIQEAGDQEDPI